MIIRKKSTLTGKINTMELDVTNSQLKRYEEGSELVQSIFPNMNVDEREFLISGVTPTEWAKSFGKEE